jgi:hypothetical protein
MTKKRPAIEMLSGGSEKSGEMPRDNRLHQHRQHHDQVHALTFTGLCFLLIVQCLSFASGVAP